jgi:hypothetical protein
VFFALVSFAFDRCFRGVSASGLLRGGHRPDLRPKLSTGRRLGLTVLRGYFVVAVGMVIVRIVQLALTH